jgi:hypothetical protein
MPGRLQVKGLYSLDSDNTDTRQGAGASNVLPFRRPNAPVVTPRRELRLRPEPTLCLDAAMLTPPPLGVQQALATHPMEPPLSSLNPEAHSDYERRYPHGLWTTGGGTKILFNRKKQPLFIWRLCARKPERYSPALHNTAHWRPGIASADRFYRDVEAIGREALWHAVATLAAAWERGDIRTANVLEAWLVYKHKTYLQIMRAYREDMAQWRTERDLFEDIMHGPINPAKPA